MSDRKIGDLYAVFKTIGFSLYFVVLFVERLFALIFSYGRGEEYALSSGNAFNYVAYAVTAASLAAGTVLFVRLFIKVIGSICAGKGYDFDADARDWSVASFVLLFGGMMHTGQTVAPLQFAAYGFLIGAMIVRCVEACAAGESKVVTITSTVYLTLFSMSIPVCYISFLSDPQRILFFVSEYAAVFVLVPIFGLMLSSLMRTGRTPFTPIYPGIMALLSGATLALKWAESVNMFVLIFASATLLFYLIALPLFRRAECVSAIRREEGDGGHDHI